MSDKWKMADDEASMPIGTGSENGQIDVPFPAEKKPRIQGMTLALFGVFVGGLALVYVLGMQHKPRSADAAGTETDQRINTALENLAAKAGKVDQLKKIFADTDQLVRIFNGYPGKNSRPLEALPMNPFEQETTKPTEPVLDPRPGVDQSAEERQRLQKLAEAFGQLKLQSVMISAGFNAAQINGRLVTAGAKIGDFTVESIEAKRVILSSAGQRFELLVSQPKTDQ